MSESLQIRHGDLALNGGSLATVKGGQKLVQDLRCVLLTPLGSYEGQPDFGSNLTTSEGAIGSVEWSRAATLVQTEINRVCADYQRRQISRNQEDATRFGRLTIEPNETLLKVEDINFLEVQDKLIVSVELLVGSEIVTINVPLEH